MHVLSQTRTMALFDPQRAGLAENWGQQNFPSRSQSPGGWPSMDISHILFTSAWRLHVTEHVSLTSVRHWTRQPDVCPSLNTSAWRLSVTEHHTPLVTMTPNGTYGVKNKTTTPHRFVLAGSTSHFPLNICAGSNLKHFVLIRSIYIYLTKFEHGRMRPCQENNKICFTFLSQVRS